MNQNVIQRNQRRHRETVKYCVCTECGEGIKHKIGIPCLEEKCPTCGANMVRVGSYHYRKWQKEQAIKES